MFGIPVIFFYLFLLLIYRRKAVCIEYRGKRSINHNECELLKCCSCRLHFDQKVFVGSNQTTKCLRIKGEGWSTANYLTPQVILLLAVPRRLFCSGSLVISDVVSHYSSLFLLYINMKIGKIDVKG